MRAQLIAGVALMATLALPALAEEQVLTIDPETSRATFTVGSTLHTVEGTLTLTGGRIRFDTETGLASGEIVLDARRTVTGNSDRDKKMHRKVLESERYPEIVFTAERIAGEVPTSGEGDVVLSGTITVHGAGHPIELPAHLIRTGDRIHATTSAQIPYIEWGMKDPSVLVLRVAKQVDVEAEIEGEVTR